jgi:hypothetical protein
MELWRISRSKCSGDSTLRIGGRRVEERTFREDQDLAVLRRTPCRMESGDAAPDDEKPGPDE